jgi:hypothetical protein
MPIYTYRCSNGHAYDRYLALADYARPQVCDCGRVGLRMICAPLLVKAQAECRYDSPIDGHAVTSWAARRDDLARNNCQPYDPEMKTDMLRRRQDADAAIEKSVDATVDEAFEKMPTAQRAKLASEVTEQGADCGYVRGTV